MDTEEPKQNLDKSYADPALTAVRKALKGNGIRPADVTLKNLETETLNFTAVTQIKLSSKTIEKSAGVASGAPAEYPDRQAAGAAADEYNKSITKDPSATTEIKKLLIAGDNQGFGLNNQTIKLPFLDKDFVSSDSCRPCQGKGQAPCTNCHGEGYQPCPHCHAQGFEVCKECNGSRQTRTPQGQMTSCTRCQGLGKTSCSFCRESRKIQCNLCKAQGILKCKTCNGQGAQTNIISSNTTAQCSFDFDAQKMSAKTAALVKDLGAKLAGHAKISLAKPDDEEEDEKNEMALFFNVKLPEGTAEFAIKDRSIKAYLFGIKGTIKDIPNFLDGQLSPGIESLKKAADGQGNINENLQASLKYKTLKQAVTLAARYKAKKAIHALLHYTPIGLSKKTAQKLVEDANAALNNLTKQKRAIAIAAGAVCGLACSAAYFMSPLRGTVMSLLADIVTPSMHILVDAGAAALCAVMAVGVWKFLASKAKKQALDSLMSSKK
jgi:hypothetical protein